MMRNYIPRPRPNRRWLPLVMFAAIGTSGCGTRPQAAPADTRGSAKVPAEQAFGRKPGEIWDVYFIRDPATGQPRRSGYRQTTQQELVRSGRACRRTEAVDHLEFLRFGKPVAVELRSVSIESLQGEVIEFQYEIATEPSPRRGVGTIRGDTLHYELTTAGKTSSSEQPWPADCRGFFGLEQSLRARPMKTGEQRSLRLFVPLFDVIATVELTARSVEDVSLLERTMPLLRIDAAMKLADGQVIQSEMWVDDAGEVRKTRTASLGQEMIRTTRRVALDHSQPSDVDLGLDVLVPVDPPLDAPHAAAWIEYEVTLEGTDPATVFVACPSQEVNSLDEQTARIVVRAVRPQSPAVVPAAARPPTDEDRRPSPLVESDDPRIVAMAGGVAKDQADPWQVALALEKYVHQAVATIDFGQMFATAAEVAESRKGDCTEHAVLLAALCRARGIPARVAIGLVYVRGRGGFLYHMWNEVWIEDRWVPLDATLGRGGIGGGHLKVADLSLAGASAFTSFLPVLKVIGRLTIRVVRTG